MTHSPSQATNRVGPFVAGSTSSDLIALAGRTELGLRVLEQEEQKRDYYKARCEALELAAQEFFYHYSGSSSLIVQKTKDTPYLPEFIEYAFCWFAEDHLAGLVLSGVASDAGNHEQINEQEAAGWEQTTEIAEALSKKYNESPGVFLNFLNFEIYPSPPQHPGIEPEKVFSSYDELVNSTEDNVTKPRIETHYCGPALVLQSRKRHDEEIPTAATHSSQSSRKIFANPEFLVVYDSKIERYVRTIESLHVFHNVIYISRKHADDLGRRLNAQRCAQVQAEARQEIDRWKESIRQAEESKRARIQKLVEIL
jgi:hypothetical protein